MASLINGTTTRGLMLVTESQNINCIHSTMVRRRKSPPEMSTKRSLAGEFNEEASPKVLMAARKIAPITGCTKKPYRYRPGTVALREIKKYQKSSKLLLSKLAFNRLTRQTIHKDTSKNVAKLTSVCIQEFTELHFAHLLDDANCFAIHAKRVTIKPKDMHVARMIRGEIPKIFVDDDKKDDE